MITKQSTILHEYFHINLKNIIQTQTYKNGHSQTKIHTKEFIVRFKF